MSLLRRLFSRRSGFAAALAPQRAFTAIGDIHGRDDLLVALLAWLAAAPAGVTVFTGDYIDRGPSSAAVLRRLRALSRCDDVVCLMGNHEAMLLGFLDAPAAQGRLWLRNGGIETLASFGLDRLPRLVAEADFVALRDRFAAALDPGLESWIRDLPLWWQSGNVAVVHAGADPDRDLAAQDRDRLLWGHPAFARRVRRDGIWIVHGHRIVAAPEIRDGRIAIDTGAYATDRLTAARVTPEGVDFVTT